MIESGRLPFSTETYEGFYRQFTVRAPYNCDEIMLICTVNPHKISAEEIIKNQEDFVEFFENGPGKILNVSSLYYEEQMKGLVTQKIYI